MHGKKGNNYMMDIVYQGQQAPAKIIQTKKTVDWMITHTTVNVFNPITFEGYQRSIDDKHCEKIVAYLKSKFFFPTAVICASRNKYSENENLYIVDGQHRIEALKKLKICDLKRYNEIKENELPVIVLEEAEIEVEIETFITINKTAKKVDTSLAYVLKNKLNNDKASADIGISKREYLAVELAVALNDSKGMWENKILFEGQPKQTPQLISLNSFVVSMRTFLGALQRHNILIQDWTTSEELEDCIASLCDLVNSIWNQIQYKWPDLFNSDLENRRIIQGSIGFTAINKYLILNLKETTGLKSMNEFSNCAATWIQEIHLSDSVWLPGKQFSRYSSASGHSIVAQELLESAGRFKY